MITLKAVRDKLCREDSYVCKQCGYRVRGINHEEGTHHRTGKHVDDSKSKKK